MKSLIAIGVVLALTGCASSGDYETYVKAQSDANRQAWMETA